MITAVAVFSVSHRPKQTSMNEGESGQLQKFQYLVVSILIKEKMNLAVIVNLFVDRSLFV